MIPYASNTGTRRNLEALRVFSWRLLLTPDNPKRKDGLRYAIDNGAWKAFQQGTPFDERSFWMNPPYGCENLDKWLRKAMDSASRGATVVALVPTRTNPPWWHDYVMKSHEIHFIVKKLAFDGPKDGVPFTGHALVVFRPGELSQSGPRCFSWFQ